MTGLIPSPIEDQADKVLSVQSECELQFETSSSEAAIGQVESYVQNEIVNCELINAPSQVRMNQTKHSTPNNGTNGLDSRRPTNQAIKVTVQSDLPNQVDSNFAQSDVQSGMGVDEFKNPNQDQKNVQQERNDIIADLNRRVRYLLTLKGRPPFCLAGLEMFNRLGEVVDCIEIMISHEADSRLVQLCEGIRVGINEVCDQMQELSVAAGWLREISDLLDPEGKAPRTAAQVNQELSDYLCKIRAQNQSPSLDQIAKQLQRTTTSYSAGLFVSYDVVGLARTNNERESEFRLLTSRILRTQ